MRWHCKKCDVLFNTKIQSVPPDCFNCGSSEFVERYWLQTTTNYILDPRERDD